MKIELHTQFKVPLDGLIPLAEEITIRKEKTKAANQPFTKVEKQKDVFAGSPAAASPREEADDESAPLDVSDRKANKKLVKLQAREKRKLKKQLKNAF